jgi:hypothetical protein
VKKGEDEVTGEKHGDDEAKNGFIHGEPQIRSHPRA